jgi:hypothetical protein
MKTAMQELFSQLEIEHPNLFNTNTLEGRKFINDYYKFFEMEKQQTCSFGAECCMMTRQHRSWNIEDLYNETFKTK